jgi:hypothetical protein
LYSHALELGHAFRSRMLNWRQLKAKWFAMGIETIANRR